MTFSVNTLYNSFTMDVKDFADIAYKLRQESWLLWGFLVTVHVAIIGWLFSKAGMLARNQKIIATIIYIFFLVQIILGLVENYSDRKNVAIAVEIMAAKSTSAADRIVSELLDKDRNFMPKLAYASVATGGMAVLILYLVWSDNVWNFIERKDLRLFWRQRNTK